MKPEVLIKVNLHDGPKIPEPVQRYMEWFKAAHGFNPLEPLDCPRCHNPVPLMSIYRCYDCDVGFCKTCLIAHCKESIQRSRGDTPGHFAGKEQT